MAETLRQQRYEELKKSPLYQVSEALGVLGGSRIEVSRIADMFYAAELALKTAQAQIDLDLFIDQLVQAELIPNEILMFGHDSRTPLLSGDLVGHGSSALTHFPFTLVRLGVIPQSRLDHTLSGRFKPEEENKHLVELLYASGAEVTARRAPSLVNYREKAFVQEYQKNTKFPGVQVRIGILEEMLAQPSRLTSFPNIEYAKVLLSPPLYRASFSHRFSS